MSENEKEINLDDLKAEEKLEMIFIARGAFSAEKGKAEWKHISRTEPWKCDSKLRHSRLSGESWQAETHELSCSHSLHRIDYLIATLNKEEEMSYRRQRVSKKSIWSDLNIFFCSHEMKV